MTLVIDILRHGDAEPLGPAGDATRPLSSAGVSQISLLAARLAANGWAPDRAFASPLARAQETGRLMLDALAAPPGLETLAELHPEGEPDDLLRALASAGVGGGHLLLISHMPLVSRICAFLAGAHAAFRTADLARIECADGPIRSGAIWRGFPARQDSG